MNKYDTPSLSVRKKHMPILCPLTNKSRRETDGRILFARKKVRDAPQEEGKKKKKLFVDRPSSYPTRTDPPTAFQSLEHVGVLEILAVGIPVMSSSRTMTSHVSENSHPYHPPLSYPYLSAEGSKPYANAFGHIT